MSGGKLNNISDLVIKFSCPDQSGIVAAVASLFNDIGFNIRESSQFEDVQKKQFFMRTVFNVTAKQPPRFSIEQLRNEFCGLANKYEMRWEMHDLNYRPKVIIAVSKWGHCLNNLLNSWKLGSLPIDIVGVVSNHRDMQSLVEWYGLPYHYLEIVNGQKIEQEERLRRLFTDTDTDFLVLARYMQILSDTFCDDFSGRIINIHHSFLPGFKGSKPYHQAFERGVKLIGATAHFVTGDLDEGPIIEQAVERVSHANSPEELVSIGRDVEAVVLQRAVRWHAEHRVLLNGNKTVIFRR
ncbi:formyltetrahydrofolate deformylase [Aurantivibrio infirmus]